VRSVEFHPEAEAELVSAAQYFESHVGNLGLDFILAVGRACERSVAHLRRRPGYWRSRL
jgi:hypothetical protein